MFEEFVFTTIDSSGSLKSSVDTIATKIFGMGEEVGDGTFDYQIKKTTKNSSFVDYNDKTHGLNTILFTMTARVKNPSKYEISHARMKIDFKDPQIKILSYQPKETGIKSDIEKTGSNEITFGLEGSIGFSTKSTKEKTIKNKDSSITDSTEVNLGPTLTGNTSFNKKDGWKVTLSREIWEQKGYSNLKENGARELYFDTYNNEASKVPRDNKGETTVIFALVVLAVPNTMNNFPITYSLEGKAKGLSFPNKLLSKDIRKESTRYSIILPS